MHANCTGMYQNRRILLYFWAMIPFRMKMKRLSLHILLAAVLAASLSCEKNPQPVTPSGQTVDPDPPTPAKVVDYDKYQLKELAAKAGIKLGVAFTEGEYSPTVEAILKKDFAAVTFGNEMKHDAIVSQSGTYVFDRADKMAGWAKSCGNELFGHTLGWHSQQQRTYLNKVIANAAPNNKASLLRENWNFETGTLNGFVADEFEVFSDLYDVFAGDYAAKAVNDRATLQIDVPIEEGKTYTVSFWAKSLARSAVESNVGVITGDGQGTVAVVTSFWNKFFVTFPTEAVGEFAYRIFATKDVVIDNIRVIDIEGQSSGDDEEEPVVIDFESYSAGGAGQLTSSGTFVQVNGPDYVSVTNETAHGGSLSLKMDNSSGYAKDSWDIQVVTKSFPVRRGHTYRLSWYAKAGKTADFQIDIRGDGDVKYPNSQYGAFPKVGTDWTLQSYDYTVESDTELSFAFYGGVDATTYYIDDIRLEPVSGASFAPARRQAPSLQSAFNLAGELANDAIGHVYRDWVYTMVGHFDVYGWDVVNETFGDWPVGFRDGSNTDLSKNFVWGLYFKSTKDWVDKAFAYATDALQRNGKTAVLYLNDYNLETSDAKRKAYCDYVKGNPQVTGVGTQMHLDMAGITREQIEASLKDLAATGRIVRISELDIKCTDQKAQADLYKFIFEKYLEIVPEAQRGGITIWGINDKDSWVGNNNMPLLYRGDGYVRKPAYETLYLYLCERAGLNPYKE